MIFAFTDIPVIHLSDDERLTKNHKEAWLNSQSFQKMNSFISLFH